jgi:hypothetical protein
VPRARAPPDSGHLAGGKAALPAWRHSAWAHPAPGFLYPQSQRPHVRIPGRGHVTRRDRYKTGPADRRERGEEGAS